MLPSKNEDRVNPGFNLGRLAAKIARWSTQSSSSSPWRCRVNCLLWFCIPPPFCLLRAVFPIGCNPRPFRGTVFLPPVQMFYKSLFVSKRAVTRSWFRICSLPIRSLKMHPLFSLKNFSWNAFTRLPTFLFNVKPSLLSASPLFYNCVPFLHGFIS